MKLNQKKYKSRFLKDSEKKSVLTAFKEKKKISKSGHQTESLRLAFICFCESMAVATASCLPANTVLLARASTVPRGQVTNSKEKQRLKK